MKRLIKGTMVFMACACGGRLKVAPEWGADALLPWEISSLLTGLPVVNSSSLGSPGKAGLIS